MDENGVFHWSESEPKDGPKSPEHQPKSVISPSSIPNPNPSAKPSSSQDVPFFSYPPYHPFLYQDQQMISFQPSHFRVEQMLNHQAAAEESLRDDTVVNEKSDEKNDGQEGVIKSTEKYSLKTSIPISKLDFRSAQGGVFINKNLDKEKLQTLESKKDVIQVSNDILEVKEDGSGGSNSHRFRELITSQKPNVSNSSSSEYNTNEKADEIAKMYAINNSKVALIIPNREDRLNGIPILKSSVNAGTISNTKQNSNLDQTLMLNPSVNSSSKVNMILNNCISNPIMIANPNAVTNLKMTPTLKQTLGSNDSIKTMPNNNANPTLNEMLYPNNVDKNNIIVNMNPLGLNATNSNMVVNLNPNIPKNSVIQSGNSISNQSLMQHASQNSLFNSKAIVITNGNQTVNKDEGHILAADNFGENVVALKRLHHDNVDEDDFENLITENQIYGNKIVIKEKCKNRMDTRPKKKLHFDPEQKANQGKAMIISNEIILPARPLADFNVGANRLQFNTKTTTRIVNPLTQSFSQVRFNSDTRPTNVLQTLLNRPIKLDNSKIACHLPVLVEGDDSANLVPDKPMPEMNLLQKRLKSIEMKNESKKEEEVVYSSLDLAERRMLKKRQTKVPKCKKKKPTPVPIEEAQEFRLSFKQYQMFVGIVGEAYFEESSSEESETESEDDDTMEREIRRLTCDSPRMLTPSSDKIEFMGFFGLTTLVNKQDRELEMLEKSIKFDAVQSALSDALPDISNINSSFSLPPPKITEKLVAVDNKKKTEEKMSFLGQLKLTKVSKSYKIGCENSWLKTLKERQKQNEASPLLRYHEELSRAQAEYDKMVDAKREVIDAHTKDQLDMMTEIKKSVNENNNLLKKAIDDLLSPGADQTNKQGIIHALAEKNFSEISRLSRMADNSLKIFGRHQKPEKCEGLNIPNVPKVIALKTSQDSSVMDISPATSMDEPRNSAAGANVKTLRSVETQCEDQQYQWPGLEGIMEAYKRYRMGRRKEQDRLNEENRRLRRIIKTRQIEGTSLANELRQLAQRHQVCEEQQKYLQASLDRINDCIFTLVA